MGTRLLLWRLLVGLVAASLIVYTGFWVHVIAYHKAHNASLAVNVNTISEFDITSGFIWFMAVTVGLSVTACVIISHWKISAIMIAVIGIISIAMYANYDANITPELETIRETAAPAFKVNNGS